MGFSLLTQQIPLHVELVLYVCHCMICVHLRHTLFPDLEAQSTSSVPMETQFETEETVSEMSTGMYTLLNQSFQYNTLYSPAASLPRKRRKRVTEPPSLPAPKRTASMTEQSKKETQSATSSDVGQCI